jgi:hypothetical protein
MARNADAQESDASSDIYFETTIIGATAKVVAIDGASGVEVSVFGPAHAAESELKRLALAKLRARIARQGGGPI